MPAEFEKAMDYTLLGLENNYCFIEDIIIVSTESESYLLSYVIKCQMTIIWELNSKISFP